MRRAVCGVLLALLVFTAPITGVATVAADEDDSSGPPERWTQTAGGSDDDKLATGLQVEDGYLVVGWSNSSASDGEYDGYVAMLDRSGQTKWEQTYGEDGDDRVFDVEQVEDGYLLVGVTAATTDGEWDGWMLKIDEDGEKQWERTYGESGDDALWSVTRSDDQIYVGGWQKGGSSAEAWAMELESDGKQVWSQTYDTVRSGADEYVNSIFVADDGQLLMTGTSRGSTADPADAWVLKVDSSDGDVKWDETYGGAKYDQVHDAVAAPDGGYVLAGHTASNGEDDRNGWMLKIDEDGEKEWDRTYGTDRKDSFFGIHNDPDGGYVLSGNKHLLGPEGADGWVVKTDGDGHKQWERTYGDEYWDKFWPVIEGHDGGYLAIGETTSYGENRNGWLVRIGGPATSAIVDADENESGTTVEMEGSPVRAVTLSDSNVSGFVSVAEETNVSALSPPGDSLYAVTVSGSDDVANASAMVEFTVQNDSIPTEVSDLRVAERTDDGWELLETSVVSTDNGTTVISAETDGSSTLAVTSVPAPTASIDSDDVVSVGDSVDLSAESSTAENGSLAEYEWVIDGETYSGETASVSFDEPGEYDVELTVIDENGLRDTETMTLLANDQPEVSVETPDSVTVGKAGSFSADVSNEVGDVTVTWQFGSGAVTGESVEHSFGSPGTKTITVVVEDEYGATVTKEVEVQVESQDGNVEQTTTTTNDGGIPGFGVATALVALLAAALLARRAS
jgi:PGF-CTERM protein